MRVLIADDEVVARRLLESSLRRWGYEVLVAQDGAEAARILLAPDGPKLAILDWMMPQIDGIQLCGDIRRNKPEPYTYLLLVTAKREQEDVILGLEAGADDYITKPFNAAELKVRLRTGKRILYLQDQLISAREALRDRATRDQLTGLWNRAAILDMVGDELSRTRREGASLGIALADLDHFKRVNDQFGHATGDELLRQAAHTMQATVRRYDAVGRYGGEEFLILLPGCNLTNAVSHAERLRTSVGNIVLATPAGDVSPTVSIGVVVATATDAVETCDLVQSADAALYRAKHRGRNCVEPGRVTQSLLAPGPIALDAAMPW
ncbi:MAG: diguanylate cyclase [Pirellulales bacterium]